MKKSSFFISAILLASSLSAQAADNGLSDAESYNAAFLGPIGTQVNGPWLEFRFGAAGTEVFQCGGGCVPSSGGNSVELMSDPPWTFSLPFGGGSLKVTDAFANGDSFDVWNNGGSIGLTPAVAASGSCGSDPAVCYPDAASSSAEFPLAAGDHAVTLFMVDSPFGGGAAYFRVDSAAATVDIDIKFCSNPNSYNSKKKGVLPVTIFGNGVDVTTIDTSTLQLCTDAAGTDCTPAGVRDSSIADRGDPTTDLGADSCAIDPTTGEELDYLNQDGIDDMDVAFEARDVSALIGPVSRGDLVGPLYLVGYLDDSTPITSVPVNSIGVDWLRIVK